MTDNSDNKYARCLYFDGTCPKCRRAVRRIRPLLNRKGIAMAPFANGADEPEMRLTWSDGRVFGGANAAIFLTRQFWWSWQLFLITLLPGVRPLLARAYRHIAANRHCQNGACSLDTPIGKPADPGKSRLILGIAVTPLLAAPVAVLSRLTRLLLAARTSRAMMTRQSFLAWLSAAMMWLLASFLHAVLTP